MAITRHRVFVIFFVRSQLEGPGQLGRLEILMSTIKTTTIFQTIREPLDNSSHLNRLISLVGPPSPTCVPHLVTMTLYGLRKWDRMRE